MSPRSGQRPIEVRPRLDLDPRRRVGRPIGPITISEVGGTEAGREFLVEATSQTGTMGSTTVTESRTESGTTVTVKYAGG